MFSLFFLNLVLCFKLDQEVNIQFMEMQGEQSRARADAKKGNVALAEVLAEFRHRLLLLA